MDQKALHRGFGVLSFVVALVTFLMTVQPSVPFWDCGEFTAASVLQQVPHPPGAPLFLMIGKVFHLLPFGDPGWRVNLVSVFSSAFCAWLLYLITVKVIQNFRKTPVATMGDAIAVYGSSMIGALALTFSDTFWFNAVESEVYAASSLFVALITYLMMRWNEEADNPGHERYLLLIAYLIGLSTGVHLLSILAIFSIALVVYFRKYEFRWKTFLIMGAIAVGIFIGIYPGVVKWFPALLAGNLPFKSEAKEYYVENSFFVTLIGISLVVASAYWLWKGYKANRRMMALASSAFLLIVLGYSSYAHILIRANSKPPMNENNPKDFTTLVSYLGREQYGDAPNWPRRYRYDDPYYTNRYSDYGEWTAPEIDRAPRRDGSSYPVPRYNRVNAAGELNYMWEYQIEHMYLRYFFWNFVGRLSDVQDAPAVWFSAPGAEEFNYNSGFADRFPVRFFALPLLFGLIGMYYHFKKDPQMALAFMSMFLVMGVLATLQQNQQNPQPRERDYFYVGSFMVFCLWIGLGVYALIDLLRQHRENVSTGIAGGIVVASLVLVPVNMAKGGWGVHSRAGNFVPFDYSYNILQSLEKDAILFTNGDNDTFPLWYLQDVAGIRRDVRIVNLSLGNTLWYIDQLKNQEPHGAKKIPLTFTDESLRVADEADPRALSTDFGFAKDIEIEVNPEIMKKYGNPALAPDSKMRTKFSGMEYGQREGQQYYAFRVQDKLVLDILQQTKFERPVYYSITVGPDAMCGLERFFRLEGMAYRICPTPQQSTAQGEAIDASVMEKSLMHPISADVAHSEPHLGFKFRNLDNSGVYYDEVHRRLMSNYRSLFMRYAMYRMDEQSDKQGAVAVLDSMNRLISPVQFPMSYGILYNIAQFYDRAGAQKQAREFATRAIESSQRIIDNPKLANIDRESRGISPYLVIADSYGILGDVQKSREKLQQLQQMQGGNDASIQAKIDELEINAYERQGNYRAALDATEKLIARYQASDSPFQKSMAINLQAKATELRQKLGMPAAMPQADTAQQGIQ